MGCLLDISTKFVTEEDQIGKGGLENSSMDSSMDSSINMNIEILTTVITGSLPVIIIIGHKPNIFKYHPVIYIVVDEIFQIFANGKCVGSTSHPCCADYNWK